MRPPAPGIPDRRGALAARIRVWYRLPRPHEPHVVSMEVDLRGAGAGGQDLLEAQLHELIPAGAELRGYELIA